MKKLILLMIANLSMLYASAANLDSLQRIANYKDSLLRIEYKVVKLKLLQTLIQQRTAYQVIIEANNNSYNLGSPVDIVLTDSGYQFKFATNNIVIQFDYLTNLRIKVYNANNSIQGNASTPVSQLKIGGVRITTSSDQQYILSNISNQLKKVQDLHNDIYFQINQFEVWVAQYLQASEKPAASEAQRKYIIQADAATKLYQYEKSIQLNQYIIQLNPTNYPDVYRNIAVLQGETDRLHAAMHNMQKYLLFPQNEEDIKFAKQKIEEWQIILNN